MVRNADSPNVSLIEKRQRRVRREVATTALAMFSEQGYDRTTVEDIAAAVEISPSTFYRHFPTKSDVVVELPRLRMRDIGEAVAARPAEESLAEAIEAAVQEVSLELGQDAASLKRFEKLLAANTEMRGRLLGEQANDLPLVAEIIAPRLGRSADDLATQVAATAIMGAIRLAFERWCQDGEDENPSQALQQALGVLKPLFTSLADSQPISARTRRRGRPTPSDAS
jgi:AcrR family transcriptional regulator